MIWVDNESASAKKKFYALASKAELTDIYAKARFDAEPWHLTDLKKRKEIEDAYRREDDNGSDGV